MVSPVFLQAAFQIVFNEGLPDTREAYRAAVDAVDLSTEAGMELYVKLMELSKTADGYYDYLEDAAEDIASKTKSFNTALDDIISKNTLSDYDYAFVQLYEWYDAQIEIIGKTGGELTKVVEAFEIQRDAINLAEKNRLAGILNDARNIYLGSLDKEFDKIQAEIDIKKDLIDTNQDLIDSFIDLKTDISDFQDSLVCSGGISDPSYQLSFAKPQMESAVQGLYSGDSDTVQESLKDIPGLSKDLLDASGKANTDRQDHLDVLGYVQKILNSSNDIAGVQVNRTQSTIDELALQTAS